VRVMGRSTCSECFFRRLPSSRHFPRLISRGWVTTCGSLSRAGHGTYRSLSGGLCKAGIQASRSCLFISATSTAWRGCAWHWIALIQTRSFLLSNAKLCGALSVGCARDRKPNQLLHRVAVPGSVQAIRRSGRAATGELFVNPFRSFDLRAFASSLFLSDFGPRPSFGLRISAIVTQINNNLPPPSRAPRIWHTTH